MKRLAALLLLVLVAIPVPVLASSPQVAVRGEGYVGYHDLDFFFVEEDGFQGGGAGSVAIVGDALFFQLDIGGDSIDYSGGDAESIYAGGHLGWRDPDAGSIGAVGMFQLFDPGDADIDSWRAGADIEAYLGLFTLGLEAGYSDLADDAYVLARGRLYPIEDMSLELRVGAADPGDSDPLTLVGAGGEYLIGGHVAIFSRVEASFLDDTDFDQTSVHAGVRIYFGGDSGTTLMGYDRGFFQRGCLGMPLVFRSC